MTEREFIQRYCIENSHNWGDDNLVKKARRVAEALIRQGVPFDEEETKPQETIVNIDEQ